MVPAVSALRGGLSHSPIRFQFLGDTKGRKQKAGTRQGSNSHGALDHGAVQSWRINQHPTFRNLWIYLRKISGHKDDSEKQWLCLSSHSEAEKCSNLQIFSDSEGEKRPKPLRSLPSHSRQWLTSEGARLAAEQSLLGLKGPHPPPTFRRVLNNLLLFKI